MPYDKRLLWLLQLHRCPLHTCEAVYMGSTRMRHRMWTSVIVKPRDTEWASFCSTLCTQQTKTFHLVDLGQLLHSHQLWKKNMPHISPYYSEAACSSAPAGAWTHCVASYACSGQWYNCWSHAGLMQCIIYDTFIMCP